MESHPVSRYRFRAYSAHQPYTDPKSNANKSGHLVNPERNKFKVLDSPMMARTIPGWELALAAVDTTGSVGPQPLHRYVLPEPALLISSDDARRRNTFLHHYQLMRDALLYLLGHPDPDAPYQGLSAQEWRDVMLGKIAERGKLGSRARKRAAGIEEVLGPAMRACDLKQFDDFPAAYVPQTSFVRAQEITWELAEMNFRYELPALDARASGLDRPDECMQCFPGRPIGPDLGESKLGFAAISSSERLPYLLCLAILMQDWRPRPRPDMLEGIKQVEWTWTPDMIAKLEEQVARYYTQNFYDYFGRPAIIPMRLEHELGTGIVIAKPVEQVYVPGGDIYNDEDEML